MLLRVLKFMLLLPMAAMTAFKPLSHLLPLLGHPEKGRQVAFFVFGDSLLDAGNNDYLAGVPKTNYWPYGETFFHYPTGRPCDGRIPPDFIAEHAKLPLIKPYLDPNFTDYTYGANFASSGAGVLPQTRPGTLYLALQVSFFEEVIQRLKQQKGDKNTRELISQAVYHFGIGGNDYLVFENETIYSNTTVSFHEKEVYVSWVIGNLTTSIKKVYGLGGRKFSFQNCGPIGCMPSSRFEMRVDGCWHDTELLAHMHNKALTRLVVELERELPGFKYALFDYHGALLDRIMNSSKFGNPYITPVPLFDWISAGLNYLDIVGFADGKSACCGSGAYNGNFTCGDKGDYFALCPNPNEFVFFDPAHPTERANRQLSSLMWSGESPVIGPHNLKSFFEDID